MLPLFRSKGQAQAMFLRHEGFLGALGAFLSYEKHGLDDLMVHQFVERFPMGAPYIGGNVHGPPLGDLNEKVGFQHSRAYCCIFRLMSTLICYINSHTHTH